MSPTSLILCMMIISTFLQFICESKRTKRSKPRNKHCDNIDSGSNSIFNTKLCGNMVFDTDIDYENARHQYASVSFSENVMPSMIVFVKCDEDIKIALYYANQCGYKVVIRSGGHQYSGLSSCNLQRHRCIQLDLSAYTKIKQARNGDIEVGVGVHLKDLNVYLKKKGLFLPHGDCETVGVGGHIQTGGEGPIHNQFGFISDHVTGFDIFLANGELVQVSEASNWQINIAKTKEEIVDNHAFNEILFGSVLSGLAPGSFGVITSVRFAPLYDEHYYKTSVFYSCDWQFNHLILNNILRVMQQIYAEVDDFNLLNTDYTFYIRLAKGQLYGDIIRFRGTFVSTSGADLNQTYFDRFIAAGNDIQNVQCDPMYMSPSEYLNGGLIPLLFESPRYRTRMQRTPYLLSDEFITRYVDTVQQLYNDDKFKSILFYSDIVYQGGNSIFVKPATRTAKLQVNTQLVWEETMAIDTQDIVENWMIHTWSLLMNTSTFGFGEIDCRGFGTTFGDLEIENVWQFYYRDEEHYNSLRLTKATVDPNNVFSNTMTIKPLFHDGRYQGMLPIISLLIVLLIQIAYIMQLVRKMYYLDSKTEQLNN